MPTLRPWPRVALTLLICLLAAGCGSRGAAGTAGISAAGRSGTSAGSAAGDGTEAGAAAAAGAPGEVGGGAGGGAGSGGADSGSADSGPAAPGAPITIPDVVQSYGFDLNVVKNSIVTGQGLPTEPGTSYAGLISQCGGQLCVNIEVKPTSDPAAALLTQCQFVTTDPAPSSQVARGATIWLLTGPLPCGPPSDPAAGQPPSEPDPGAPSEPDPGTPSASSAGDPADTTSPSPAPS
jgi:hypothetical protein